MFTFRQTYMELAKQKAIILTKQLKELRELIENDKDNTKIIEELSPMIQYELCKMTKMIIPNIHQKIGEIIELENIKKVNPDSIISNKQHGVDIIVNKDSHVEIKESIIKASSGYKCNFNWNVPTGTTHDNRTNLINSVNEKTKNGHARFIIKDHIGKEVKRYEYSNEFLVEYMKRVDINTKTKNINFGCKQCQKCYSFHRLDTLKKFEQELIKKHDKTDQDWNGLLSTNVSTSC